MAENTDWDGWLNGYQDLLWLQSTKGSLQQTKVNMESVSLF